MQLSGIISTTVYVQLAGIKYTLIPYTTPAFYTIPIFNATSVDNIQLLTEPIYLAVYYLLSANYLSTAMVTTSISHGKKLSDLAKIYTKDVKYSNSNDSFTFKLAIFYNICSKADVLSKTKMKAFFTMLKSLALDYYYSNISISVVAINLTKSGILLKITLKELNTSKRFSQNRIN